MTRKLPWILATVGMGTAAVLAVKQAFFTRPPALRGDDPTAELSERLARLESGLPRLERSWTRAGQGIAAAALASAAPAAGPKEGSAEADALEKQQAAEHATQERRRYDQFDELARSGGGTVGAAQVRKNLDSLSRAIGGKPPGAPPPLAVDCSDVLCRVELASKDLPPQKLLLVARDLAEGMGDLSMRPAGQDPPGRTVFYLAAPGRVLSKL
jgi:hypothetical protein